MVIVPPAVAVSAVPSGVVESPPQAERPSVVNNVAKAMTELFLMVVFLFMVVFRPRRARNREDVQIPPEGREVVWYA